MYPKKHIIYGLIFSLFLYITLGIPSIFPFVIIFLASFLQDADHYLVYIWRKKDFNLKKAYRWHINLENNTKELNKKVHFLHLFHSVEFLILMIILSFVNKIFLYFTIGLIFHSLLDIYQLVKDNKVYTREYFLTKFIIETIV